VVIGSFGPDLEYFARFGAHGRFGHTLPGMFLFDLPVALITLWLFHRYAKQPLWAWLPRPVRRRIPLDPASTPFSSPGQWVLVVVSILIGIATHMLWDAFTHPFYWPYQYLPFLHVKIRVPILGTMPYYAFLQYVSSALGAVVVLVWWIHWSRSARLSIPPESYQRRTDRRDRVIAGIIALAAAVLRLLAASPPRYREGTAVDALVTGMTVLWIELVICGIIRRHTRSRTMTHVL
jgi:Domain of unknown function (DUF4184)